MKIGIVCPYSFDVPGGVQFHVRDLAEHLIGQGHDVSVLAPADSETELPDYVTSAGRATAVRYNGSVARLNFGPVTASKVNKWLEAGQFDVLHLHEPVTPSISVLALMAADGPIVATFHTSMLRSRTMQTAYPIIRPALEKIAGRIAVSEDARRTVTTHVGGDAVVIPNGVYVDRFASAPRRSAWIGTPASPTIAFLGRMGEPRKGLPVLAAALPDVLRSIPGLRVLVAGPGDPAEVTEGWPEDVAAACVFLGSVSDEDKASLLASVDVYVAPNTGGEQLRHHPHRGHERRGLRAGQRPAGVLARARRRLGRCDVRQRASGGPRPHPRRPAPTARSPRRAARGRGSAPRAAVRLVGRRRRDPRRLRDGHRRPRGGSPGAPRALEPLPARGCPMSEVFSWIFGVLFVLVLAGWYLSYTAARLDRLHVRLSGTLAALDARLVRRAEAAVELANSGLLDGATSLLLANAAAGSLEAPAEHGEEQRELAENDLTEALDLALTPVAVADLRSTPLGQDVLSRVGSACTRVRLARRFDNDAVTDVRRGRRTWTYPPLPPAGYTQMPHTVEFNDESPEHLAPV